MNQPSNAPTLAPAYTALILQLRELADALEQLTEQQTEFVAGEWEMQNATLAHLDGILLSHGLDRTALFDDSAQP